MPLQDSDPERRNFLVASILFIIYFYGGGKVVGDQVKLPLVNLEFENMVFLAVFAWVALFWFAYRYQITHAKSFRSAFMRELHDFTSVKFIIEALAADLNIPMALDDKDGLYMHGFCYGKHSIVVHCKYAESLSRDPTTRQPQGYQGLTDEPKEFPLTGFKGRLLSAKLLGYCAIKRPAFSSFAVPWLLFIFAIVGAVGSYIT